MLSEFHDLCFWPGGKHRGRHWTGEAGTGWSSWRRPPSRPRTPSSVSFSHCSRPSSRSSLTTSAICYKSQRFALKRLTITVTTTRLDDRISRLSCVLADVSAMFIVSRARGARGGRVRQSDCLWTSYKILDTIKHFWTLLNTIEHYWIVLNTIGGGRVRQSDYLWTSY